MEIDIIISSINIDKKEIYISNKSLITVRRPYIPHDELIFIDIDEEERTRRLRVILSDKEIEEIIKELIDKKVSSTPGSLKCNFEDTNTHKIKIFNVKIGQNPI